MNEDIERSCARVSRRRALALGGTVGLSGLIAACTGKGSGGTTTSASAYQGRTTHIHLKVHVDKATVLTSQLYFEEALIDEVYGSAPYNEHTGRENNVDNAGDGIFDESGMVTAVRAGDGYLGAINIGV